MDDLSFLKQTLALGKKGLGRTNPNPMVGAIIVKNGKIIGKGYHKKAGSPHAEIEALNSLTQDPKESTLYVNLEPCNHYGRTPPCSDAVIKAGIKKVICATQDPNQKVQGNGLKKLRQAGIAISVGLLEKEARLLNEAFFTFHEKKRPFLALKFASSLDGKIATHTGDSKWITNIKAREYARFLRNQYQAVLVGINTILKDNPHLSLRSGATGEAISSPLRIILDSTLKIPLDSIVLRDNNVLIATTIHADKEKKQKLIKKGVQILTYNSDKIPLKELLNDFTKKEIISIFVEGGSQILGSFLDEKLIDKIYAFHAPILIGGKNALSSIGGIGTNTINEAVKLQHVTYRKIGDNLLITGYPFA